MITSRLMLTTLLLGSLALPALAQAHAVAPHLNGLHHRTLRPHRIAAATNAVPDVKVPVMAATPASPTANPMAGATVGTSSTMSHAAVGTAPLAPLSTPRVMTTGPAVPGAKAN